MAHHGEETGLGLLAAFGSIARVAQLLRGQYQRQQHGRDQADFKSAMLQYLRPRRRAVIVARRSAAVDGVGLLGGQRFQRFFHDRSQFRQLAPGADGEHWRRLGQYAEDVQFIAVAFVDDRQHDCVGADADGGVGVAAGQHKQDFVRRMGEPPERYGAACFRRRRRL